MIKYKGGVKMVYPVHLDSKEKIEKISNLACKEPFDIWISSDMDMLNAKSLLNLSEVVFAIYLILLGVIATKICNVEKISLY